jgi:hypothetical protein
VTLVVSVRVRAGVRQVKEKGEGRQVGGVVGVGEGEGRREEGW